MAATVKSIQTGVETITSADGTSHDITISAVTVANSIVMYTNRNGNGSTYRVTRSLFLPSLTSTTNLNFERYDASGASDMIICWTVIEFDSGVLNVDVITGEVAKSSTTDDVTITAVTLAQTFALLHMKTDLTQLDDPSAVTGYFTSTTNFRTETGDPSGTGDCTAGYQIVEFANASDIEVQGGTISLTSGQDTNTDTITAVDLNKSFLLHMGASSGAVFNGLSRLQTRFKFNNTTTVELSDSSNEPITAGYFAVELQDSGQSVESFDATIADTATTPTVQPSWTALSTTDTAIMVAGYMPNGTITADSNEADVFPSITLDAGADGATITRVGTSNAYTLTGFAADWSAAGGNKNFMTLLGVG